MVDRKEFERRALPHAYDVIVYKEAGHYYAKDASGNVICQDSSTSCIKESIQYIKNKSASFGEGGIVKIAKGSYRVTEPIRFPYGSLFLKVKGSKGTVIVPSGNINVFDFYVGQDGEAIRYVDIEDLYIEGDINNRTATAFNFDVYDADNKLRYVALINIRNVVVHGVKRAVYAKNLWMAKFRDFEVQYSGVDVPVIFLDRSTTDMTHDIYFDRVYLEDITSTSSVVYVREPVFDVVFDNCYIDSYNKAPYLIYFENWSGRNVVSKCLFAGASAYAVRVGIHNIVRGNRITDSKGGVEIGLHFNIVTDNVISVDDIGIRGNGGHSLIIANNYIANMNTGIYLDWGSYYSQVIGNVIRDVKSSGIFVYHSEQVKIAFNQIRIEVTTAQDAIHIKDPGYNIIEGNAVSGNLSNSIVEEYSDYNTIINNIVDKPMVIVGSNTVVRNNRGYITEKSGVAAIPAGSTKTTVSHGLVKAPTKVLITPLNTPPGKLWVANITATSFDIVTDIAPTADLKVAWYAEV